MSKYRVEKSYDVVVVGGGLSGVCAAIASARGGAKTAIVQNRSMFGGNASSEIRMHVVGANSHGAKKDLAETGILLEILLENKRRNPYASFPVFDSVIWEKVRFQENLDSYLNTNMDDVVMDKNAPQNLVVIKDLKGDVISVRGEKMPQSDPLYLVKSANGDIKKVDNLESISPNDIKTMNVFKGDKGEQFKKYGYTSNGVVLVELK